MRKVFLFLIIFVSFVYFCVYYVVYFYVNDTNRIGGVEGIEKNKISFIKEEYHNGDAKFYKNQIITTVKSRLTIINPKTNTLKELPIQANWIDCYDDENLIVYGNGDNQLGICQLDNKNEVISNRIIFSGTKLMIDPSITKHQNYFYVTSTTIDGEVNNSDPKKVNGRYTVDLYKVKNPMAGNWEHISSVLSEQGNIEDGELHVQQNEMIFAFEKEEIDRGRSTLNIMTSPNLGKTWSNSKQIIKNGTDNELAYWNTTKNGWEIYYSSDINNKGESYNGSNVFVKTLDKHFNTLKNIEISSITQKGILLYDVKKTSDSLKLLYSRNYLTTSDLVEETLQLD